MANLVPSKEVCGIVCDEFLVQLYSIYLQHIKLSVKLQCNRGSLSIRIVRNGVPAIIFRLTVTTQLGIKRCTAPMPVFCPNVRAGGGLAQLQRASTAL